MSTQEISGGIRLTFTQVKVEQPESQPESLAERVLQILADGAMAKKDISDMLGQKEVSGQLNKIVRDLLEEAMIEPTMPDKPNSRHQKYRLTLGKRGFIWFCHFRAGGNPVKSSGWIPACAGMTN